MVESSEETRVVHVAIYGRPNVGKSTLMNALVGEHVAITSHHPGTTRDAVRGVVVRGRDQFVFVDTPGVHNARNQLGSRMNAYAKGAADDADVVLLLIDASRARPQLEEAEKQLLGDLPEGKRVVLALTKIDKLQKKEELFPLLQGMAEGYDFEAMVPVSSFKKDGTAVLLDAVSPFLKAGPWPYTADEMTDRPMRFFVAEYVREQILRKTRGEIPHGVAVTVDKFDESTKTPRINVTVHVDKASHKPIVLGAGGLLLKSVGTDARARVEAMYGRQVNLQTHVRVSPGWYTEPKSLDEFGYVASGAGDQTK